MTAAAHENSIALAMLPTPFEPMPRLSAALGPASLWIKRDDCTGLGGGGNKARKLDLLVADALKQGADTLVTMGAIQSNHARQTAAAAARLGLGCVLLLADSVGGRSDAYRTNGNILMDGILGADVRLLAPGTAPEPVIEETLAGLRAQGRRPYFIPVGGSNAIGSLAYRDAVLELAQQAQASGRRIDHIVVATGSGGTHAGILAGVAQAGLATRVHGISVSKPAAVAAEIVAGLIRDMAALEGREVAALTGLSVDDRFIGPGYGQPTEAMKEALALTARNEGILLDPVYTGKTMAGLIALARGGAFTAGETVVFWHTGGLPGLFAYPEAFTD